tara:strand:- start:23 stop:454 length:432 start_codon:yes stop_codon:yes gene_type:complete
MHSFKDKKILPYNVKQLYNIVIDVEKYPEFLPWCKGSEVVIRKDLNNFDAKLVVGYKAISEEYVSRVVGTYLKEISSNAISGPFRKLESNWKFNEVDNTCEVEFSIKYEFKSFLLDKLMGSLFKKASEKMFQAFEDRAKKLYN